MTSILLSKKQQDLGSGIPVAEDQVSRHKRNKDFHAQFNDSLRRMKKIGEPPIVFLDHKKDPQNPSENFLLLTLKTESSRKHQDLSVQKLNVNELNIRSLSELDRHQLIIPLTIKEAKAVSLNENSFGPFQELEFNFISDEPLFNVRLVRDEITLLKKSNDIVKKIHFVHEFCQVAWYMMTMVHTCWENLDDVVVANVSSGKIRFLPLRCYKYKDEQLENLERFEKDFVQKSIENHNDIANRLYSKYTTYFKNLLQDIFGLSFEPSTFSANSFEAKLNGLYKSIWHQNPSKETLKTIWSSLLAIFLENANKKPQKSKKEKKIDKKTDKRLKILDCMAKYAYCFVLDISAIAESDLQKLKADARKTGKADYHFYPLSAFTKEILPHTKQFRDLKAQGMRNTELITTFKNEKGIIGLYFSQEAADALQAINAVETRRAIGCGRGTTLVHKTLVIPADQVMTSKNKNAEEGFIKLGLGYKTVDMRYYHATEDLILKKGTLITREIQNFFRELGLFKDEMKHPYSYKIKVLHAFEHGYRLPQEILNRLSQRDEIVAKAVRNGFHQIQAVKIETNQELTDFSRVFQTQEKFIEGLKTVLGLCLEVQHTLPVPIAKYARKIGKQIKFKNESYEFEEANELGALFGDIDDDEDEDEPFFGDTRKTQLERYLTFGGY